MISTYLPRAGAVVLLAVFLASGFAPVAEATTYSYRQGYPDYWQGSSEGGVSSSTLESGIGRHGMPPEVQAAITALGTTPVQNLPIPVLLGVAATDITPNFGDPRDNGTRTHEGEDIMAPKDDYIVSPTDAVVMSMGTGASSGNYVYTANPGGETFAYMHLDKFAPGLVSGMALKRGDLIGYVGNTGDAAGGPTHLHFEIREGKTATDPFPRLTMTFTLIDRIASVANALQKATSQTDDVAMLMKNYRSTFVSAQATGITLPSPIVFALVAAKSASQTVASGTSARDLTLGAHGDDVVVLQTFLISKNAGLKAQALKDAGATGYFGALTKAALAEYQSANGITPAAGYYGPVTRARIALAVV